MPEPDPLEALEDGSELLLAKKKNEAFELELRLMCKKILLIILTFAACWACLEWCKPCLFGVFVFSACMWGEARLLVIPLGVSLVMLLVSYMSTLKKVLAFGEEIGKLQEMGSKID